MLRLKLMLVQSGMLARVFTVNEKFVGSTSTEISRLSGEE